MGTFEGSWGTFGPIWGTVEDIWGTFGGNMWHFLSNLVWSGLVGSVLKGSEQFGTIKPKCRDGMDGISLTSLTTRSPDGDNKVGATGMTTNF